ncbi:hypothetical protein [Tenacibaculum agarivorans]|uniref:hypothetical protein n=1 Tax=Tenacibaculum agarivorans TaxID=1908389 RepID=UPI00094B7C29|nr:hypothetical protein [Tenacibaculum agarivorans]
MDNISGLLREFIKKNMVSDTFPAIVVGYGEESKDGIKEYTVDVQKIPQNVEDKVQVYKQIQVGLDSTYVTDADKKNTKIEEKEHKNSDIIFHGVRLKASVNDLDEGIICIPRIGSWVLVSTIEKAKKQFFISQYSEVDRVIFRMNNMKDTDGGNKKPKEFFDIDIDTKSLKINYGDVFQAEMNKEALNINFLKAKGDNDKDAEAKIQSQLTYSKEELGIAFLDAKEKPTFKATFGKDKASLETANAAKKIAIVNSGDKKGIELISDEHITIEGKIVTIKGTEEINLN